MLGTRNVLLQNKYNLKTILFSLVFSTVSLVGNAQTIDSIYVNLYTDSLKKGTYNYINVDGLTSKRKYIPLDTTHLSFSSSSGKFIGNNLWIDQNLNEEKVTIKVHLKSKPELFKEFDIFIKTKPDDEVLRTADEIISEAKKKKKKS